MAYNTHMSWKEIAKLGPRNLTTSKEREEALALGVQAIVDMGYDQEYAQDYVHHERQHLQSFPEFDTGSGKKLSLVIQKQNGTGLLRMAVGANRLFTRRDMRRAVNAVDTLSEGDEKVKRTGFLKFRKR